MLIQDIKMTCTYYNKDPLALVNNMDSYFKQIPPDCSLFSQDNHEIQIHKELLYQTKFAREMIKSVGLDLNIEVICPSLSKDELETVVDFLYSGKILFSNLKKGPSHSVSKPYGPWSILQHLNVSVSYISIRISAYVRT